MHDKNGKPLAVGDSVLIRGKVTQLGTAGDYCNCTMEFDEPMPAYPGQKQSLASLNTRMVEKVD